MPHCALRKGSYTNAGDKKLTEQARLDRGTRALLDQASLGLLFLFGCRRISFFVGFTREHLFKRLDAFPKLWPSCGSIPGPNMIDAIRRMGSISLGQ
jgi:hypothetical protein